MKNIGSFLLYCWSSWELWQKLIILSVALNVASALIPEPWNQYLSLTGLAILAGMIGTWWVTSMLIPKWHEWKKQRNELLTTIRDSDQ